MTEDRAPNSDETARVRIALTMGDVAGIGPEVAARAFHVAEPGYRCCVVGHPAILERALRLIGSDLRVRAVDDPRDLAAAFAEGALPCFNPSSDDVLDVEPGTIDARAGQAACDYLLAAVKLAQTQVVDALTTSPLHKKALELAGIEAPGHTEILAQACGAAQHAMMLYLPPGEAVRGPHGLGVAHVTLHTSIRSVPDLLTVEAIRARIELLDRFLRRVGSQRPRIGVCALNPHAGESGRFGNEETTVIGPAVEAARAEFDVHGPFPADTLLHRAVAGEFDGVVAMYHDQGHIAIKLIGFDTAVNVTLGLPIVRTSPSHGTAFDIAWQGKARPDGMLAALRLAARLASHPVPHQQSPDVS
jgi:4-hydroxythreonine-4-phosphate dehydrogenase